MDSTTHTAGRSRRLLLATGLVASPVLLVLGIGLEPKVTETGAARFATIADQSLHYYLAVMFVIAGLGLLPVVGAAIAALVQGRGRVAATWAAAMFGVGGLALAVGKGFQILIWHAASPELAPYRDAFAHLDDRESAGTEVFFITGLLTTLAAAVLGTVALSRGQAVSRWIAVLFGVTFVVMLFFSGEPGIGAALAGLPFIVVSALIAPALLRRDATRSTSTRPDTRLATA